MRMRSLTRYLPGVFLALLYAIPFPQVAFAQGQEPSPIAIELIVPQQAGPGDLMSVQIQYDTVDLNAGADLNYNVYGPCHIVARDPEPSNPLANTWVPARGSARGTITIQIQVDEESDGQVVRHQVEVRWGTKAHTYEAQTQIKYVPPTATPTPVPRPTAQPTQAPAAEALPTPGKPVVELASAAFVTFDGEPAQAAASNQAIRLQVTYTSSGDLENVRVSLRFEPDVVNLDGVQRTTDGYVQVLASLPAAPQGALLFDPPLEGRIRTYVEGGKTYPLKAIVALEPAEGSTTNVPAEIGTELLQVNQSLLVTVKASVDAPTARAGSSIIVHAVCENLGDSPVQNIQLSVAGLPEGFSVNPLTQLVDHVAQYSSAGERLFTIHSPDDFEGPLAFRLAAKIDQATIESEPIVVEMSAPVPLRLEASVDRSTVYAGEGLTIHALCSNEGKLAAQGVKAKLIDLRNNLDALLQDVGDVGPGESRDLAFVVDIPPDFPADASSSLVVQTTSQDGTLSESEPVIVHVMCVPELELRVRPPAEQIEGGQSAEVIADVTNLGQCLARDVSVAVESLPSGFPAPPAQKIVELAPGTVHHVTFNILVPGSYRGDVFLVVKLSDRAGNLLQSAPTSLPVGGVPVTLVVIFGLLVILAVTAVIAGVVMYFRYR